MGKGLAILSIDGGGLRGIIPAMLLAEVENRMGKSTAQLFDLIAGASTGGILALGLAKPGQDNRPEFSAEQMVEFYETWGPRIFKRSVLRVLDPVKNLLREKYSRRGLDAALEQYFGQTRLRDAVTQLLITSYDLTYRKPIFFKSRWAEEDPHERDYSMQDVARAASAAPTYFKPATIRGADDETTAIDGGIFANNPALFAYAEGEKSLRRRRDKRLLIVSIGTGRRVVPILRRRLGWGLLGWSPTRLIDLVFQSGSEVVHRTMEYMLWAEERRYYRFQIDLDEEEKELDSATPKNILRLKTRGDRLIRDRINDLVEVLKSL